MDLVNLKLTETGMFIIHGVFPLCSCEADIPMTDKEAPNCSKDASNTVTVENSEGLCKI